MLGDWTDFCRHWLAVGAQPLQKKTWVILGGLICLSIDGIKGAGGSHVKMNSDSAPHVFRHYGTFVCTLCTLLYWIGQSTIC